MADKKTPEAVLRYARSQGLPIDHPRVQKYARSMVGRIADDEVIERPDEARPAPFGTEREPQQQ